jgi:hypothetical protein
LIDFDGSHTSFSPVFFEIIAPAAIRFSDSTTTLLCKVAFTPTKQFDFIWQCPEITT